MLLTSGLILALTWITVLSLALCVCVAASRADAAAERSYRQTLDI